MRSSASDRPRDPAQPDPASPAKAPGLLFAVLTSGVFATPLSARLSERFLRTLFYAMMIGIPLYPVAIAVELNIAQPERMAYHIDFVAIWAAAKLAIAGQAVSAFDAAILYEAQSLPPQDIELNALYWHYPPMLHLVVTPLGYLGFSLGLGIFTVCTFTFYFLAVRHWTREFPAALYLSVIAPPVYFVILTGNVTLLWVGILLIALSLLQSGRVVAAGAMIALLTFKPQLGLMIPVALIAAGHWRTLLSASATTALLIAFTAAIYGVEYWITFFSQMSTTSEIAASDTTVTMTMVTWYAFLRQLDVVHEMALTVQMVSLIIAAGTTFFLWRRADISFDYKVAGLFLATLLSTPYAYDYELVLAVMAVLFLIRAGFGRSLASQVWFAAVLLLPVLGWRSALADIANYAVFAVTLTFAVSMYAVFRRPSRAALEHPPPLG